ncbi:GtrA family protein [Pediococcus acidilactici]|uniref:GtrA family protein n=2 Tax=Lactobacillaceae TaxID=33958 RepID=UPI00155EFDFC|nr:GtrA family protein [Pediococcus acidilactici]
MDVVLFIYIKKCKVTILYSIFIKYKQVILYLFFGGLTTIINILSFEILLTNFNLYYQLCNVIAWIISVTFAYFTNKVWVFESNYTTRASFFFEFVKFYFFRLLSLGFELIIVHVGIKVLHMDPLLVKLIDNVFIVLINYIFSRVFIFLKIPKEYKKD